jgi:hypothetical protein
VEGTVSSSGLVLIAKTTPRTESFSRQHTNFF